MDPPIHDSRGNLIDDGDRWLYKYDLPGQLVEVRPRNAPPGHVFAKFTYNALGWRTSAAYDLNGNGSVLDDPRELYTYDEQWRVVAIHRQGPANQLEVNAPRPPAQLYQRFVYHQDGLPAQGVSTGVIDRVVLRQRDADDNPDTGPDGLEETLYYIQNSRGDVMQVIKPIAGPSDEWWNDDRGGYAVESVRYSLYGVPTAIASADINRDGVVDERDVSLFVNGWVQGEIDRRLDVNNNGRLETGPPTGANGLPISNWDDDDLSLFTREMWDHFYWRFLNGQNPDDGLPLFDGTGAGRGKLSREDIDNRIGAAGMWWDPHLGIYHVRHRAYDPRLGRFLQPDPIGVAGGWNVFEYVGGDPANFVDPSGLAGWEWGMLLPWYSAPAQQMQPAFSGNEQASLLLGIPLTAHLEPAVAAVERARDAGDIEAEIDAMQARQVAVATELRGVPLETLKFAFEGQMIAVSLAGSADDLVFGVFTAVVAKSIKGFVKIGEKLYARINNNGVERLVELSAKEAEEVESAIRASGGVGTKIDNGAKACGPLGNVSHGGPLTPEQALAAGRKWLGDGYKEIGKPGSGVFVSKDGTRRFRMTGGDIEGRHGNIGPHVHFEALDIDGNPIENNHVPVLP